MTLQQEFDTGIVVCLSVNEHLLLKVIALSKLAHHEKSICEATVLPVLARI